MEAEIQRRIANATLDGAVKGTNSYLRPLIAALDVQTRIIVGRRNLIGD
jgi:hypothetical protein